MQQPASITPQPIFELMTAYQRSAAIRTGIELDIFTTIGKGSKTAGEIAEAVGASERGVRILCDSFTVLGLITKSGPSYALNDVSAAFLDRNSQSFLGDAVHFLMSDAQQRGFVDLTSAVKRGGSAVEGDASMDENSEMWVKFARGMMPMMVPMAQGVADNIGRPADEPIKVLDVAAGHGIFGILTAQKYPNAEVYAADWENVLVVAKENAERFGVGGRYHTIAGDAFTSDFGGGYDVILVPNFLHHFDKEACVGFLKKCNAALNDNGKVITVEFIPNDDRVSPPMAAMFALVMLAATPAGDAYTFADLKEMAESAGFSRNEHISLSPLPSDLVISMR